LFTRNDDQVIGGHPIAVLSHGYWETQLGSDPSVVGKQITVNGQKLTIIGVGPAGFTGTTLGARPYVFIPMPLPTALSPAFNAWQNRQNYWMYVFGRPKPGATLDQAGASINTVYGAIINDVEAPQQKGMSEKTMTRFRAKKLMLSDGRRGQSSMHRNA